jgi:hypothetical protein
MALDPDTMKHLEDVKLSTVMANIRRSSSGSTLIRRLPAMVPLLEGERSRIATQSTAS